MSDFMEKWSNEINERHREAVLKGEHDEECEFRANGHFICNCKARTRIASGYTEPPGELIHNYPTCPRCFNDVSHDGNTFVCSPCHVSWPESGLGDAEFDDDHGPLDVAGWDAAKAAAA